MSDDLLDVWRNWRQPMTGGLSARGVANGLLLTAGLFWVRVRGGFLLYRGVGEAGQIDWTQPVGAAGFDAREVREFGWLARKQAGRYRHGVRIVGPGGVESEAAGEVTGCDVDASGGFVAEAPGSIERLWAEPAGEGRIRLCWQYGLGRRSGQAREFRVYAGAGGGEIDYRQPIATVRGDTARRVYMWSSDSYVSGIRLRFGVRAAGAGGEADAAEIDVTPAATMRPSEGLMAVETTRE